MLKANSSRNTYTVASQTFTANAGDTISGHAFFDTRDYLPYNDDGRIVIKSGGYEIATLFSSSVAAVGNFGQTAWTPWSYTFSSSGTFTIEAKVRNVQDGGVDSWLGFDMSENTPPVAVDDAYSVDEDNVLSVSAPGVLGNDSDPDGDDLTVSVDVGPTNGSLTLNSDGSFEYTPDPDFNGSDSFTYIADDGNGGTDSATVSITVNSVIDAVIDVKPGNGDEVDPINLGSKGKTPIAIFATQAGNGDEIDDFDPTTIDLDAIAFEINGADIDAAKLTLEDVDDDGDVDLLIHFNTPDLADILEADDTELTLTAEFGGAAIGMDLGGSDAIKIVPKKGK